MDKTIVTALLVMAGVISAVFVFNSIFPAIGRTSAAIANMEGRLDEQLKSQIEIIYATRADDRVLIWVKNVGALRISAPEASDLFFGPQGNFSRIPYGDPGSPDLHWEYFIENGTEWDPTRTARITIVGYPWLESGMYFAKMVLPNGVEDQYLFSW